MPEPIEDEAEVVADGREHGVVLVAVATAREPATAQDWLSDQPQIEVVTRDRGGGYALAVTKALPHSKGGETLSTSSD